MHRIFFLKNPTGKDFFFQENFALFIPTKYTAHCCALIFSFLLSPPLWQGWHKKSPISHTAQKIVDGQKFCHGENCHLSKKLLYCNGLPEEKNWTYTTTKNQFNILKMKTTFLGSDFNKLWGQNGCFSKKKNYVNGLKRITYIDLNYNFWNKF